MDHEAKQAYNLGRRRPILLDMSILLAVLAAVAALGAVDALALKFGAESRPGFDEKSPLV